MAKKSSILKNNKRKELSQLHKAKRQKLIATADDQSLTFEERLVAQIKLSEMPRDGARIRTPRPRSSLACSSSNLSNRAPSP